LYHNLNMIKNLHLILPKQHQSWLGIHIGRPTGHINSSFSSILPHMDSHIFLRCCNNKTHIPYIMPWNITREKVLFSIKVIVKLGGNFWESQLQTKLHLSLSYYCGYFHPSATLKWLKRLRTRDNGVFWGEITIRLFRQDKRQNNK